MMNLDHQYIVRLEHVLLEVSEMHLVLSLCSGGNLSSWRCV